MAQVYLTQAQERQAKAEKQLRIWIATQVTNQREIAKKTGLKYCTVNKRINEPETCTLEELWKGILIFTMQRNWEQITLKWIGTQEQDQRTEYGRGVFTAMRNLLVYAD